MSGLYSSATSRFTVDAATDGFTGGTPGYISALQILPGIDGARTLRFEFVDSAGVGYVFTATLADVAFETFDVFGSKKEAGDKADKGAY